MEKKIDPMDSESKIDDPSVQCIFAPPANIVGTALCPANELGLDIQNEANSLRDRYSGIVSSLCHCLSMLAKV